MGKEIERKFIIKELPADLESYAYHELEQGYLNTAPVVRVRREDDTYYLTYKGSGFIEREEYNLPLTKEAYEHLIKKADGKIISKRRYLIPYGAYTIELDVFHEPLKPLIIAEVEFPSLEEANSFTPPDWFVEDVTGDYHYSNSYLSQTS
ncbi:MAG: CYTH domain-containing protein [Lachnospiraceae bacterium]|nr:CYTH domain-containing protein [Lachnospiraceae bacterium]